MIFNNNEDDINSVSINEFGEISYEFSEQWKHLDRKEIDGELIIEWVGNWTYLEYDNFLAEKIFNVFIERHQEFIDFNEESQEEIKKTVASYLMQEEELLQRLSELKDIIINNQQCSRSKLVQVLEKSFNSEKLNRKQYELEIGELERIGLIEWNSSELVIVNPIYSELLNLNEISQRIEITSAPNTPGKVIVESSGEAQARQIGCLAIIVLGIIGFIGFCASKVMQPKPIVKDDPTPVNSLPEDCQDLRDQLGKIKDRGEERLIDRRDSLIKNIDEFQKTNGKSIESLCETEGLDEKFAELLRNQAFRLAGRSHFIGSELIRIDGEFTKYGAVRCLCLIPEELPNSEEFNELQDKMEEWKRSGQREEVMEELDMIESCPADKE